MNKLFNRYKTTFLRTYPIIWLNPKLISKNIEQSRSAIESKTMSESKKISKPIINAQANKAKKIIN